MATKTKKRSTSTRTAPTTKVETVSTTTDGSASKSTTTEGSARKPTVKGPTTKTGTKAGEPIRTQASGGGTKKRSNVARSAKGKSAQVPFSGGTEVRIFDAADVAENWTRAPLGKAAKTVKTAQDGTVSLQGLKKGLYRVGAKVDDEADRWRYAVVSVK